MSKKPWFSDWRQFRETWHYVFPFFIKYRSEVVVVMIVSLISSTADPSIALLADPFMDYYMVNPEKGRSIMWLAPIAIILLFAYRGLTTFFAQYLLERLCIKVTRDLQVALYSHFMRMSLDYYERTTIGKMISRTVNDVSYMQRIVPVTLDVIQNIFVLIFLMGVCFYKQPFFSFLAFIAIPATIYPVQRASQRMKAYTKKGLKQVAEINSAMVETYSGVKVVKAFAMEGTEIAKYERDTQRLLKINYKYIMVKNLISPIIGFITAFGLAPITYLGLKHIDDLGIMDKDALETSLTTFSTYVIALVLMYNPVRKLGAAAGNLNSAHGAAERIRETFEVKSTVTEPEDAIDIPHLKDTIKYEGVGFTYDTHKILDDFNLEIKAGSLIALVGESGSGKTTVVNLLPRFYDIQQGSITIDGVDIRKATLKSLRLQIGVVTQETFLFDDTVKNNILYGADDKTEQDVIAAAKAAFAHDFVIDLPQGYDTIIGERGVRLSGGQRQRLAIARALLKDPPILILDEATSALDTCAEREVQKALDLLMKNRTTIAIAHRLSTIRHADLIVVLRDGKVVEKGTHAELMENGAEYRRLYEMQFFLGAYATDHYGNNPPETAPANGDGLEHEDGPPLEAPPEDKS